MSSENRQAWFTRVVESGLSNQIFNPADVLALAYRGTGPFKEPIPVRTITVIPSKDAFLFAISERTGLTSLAQIGERRYPLKIAMRAQPDHSVMRRPPSTRDASARRCGPRCIRPRGAVRQRGAAAGPDRRCRCE